MQVKKLTVALLAILIAGCGIVRRVPVPASSSSPASEPGKGDFIELTNGDIVEGNISDANLSTYKSLFKGGTILLNGTKYNFKEVVAYQHGNEYFRKNEYRVFSQRIVRGAISVYRSHQTSTDKNGFGHDAGFEYHLQKNNGPMVYFEKKELRKLVQDYPPAVEWLDKYELLDKNARKSSDYYFDKSIQAYNSK